MLDEWPKSLLARLLLKIFAFNLNTKCNNKNSNNDIHNSGNNDQAIEFEEQAGAKDDGDDTGLNHSESIEYPSPSTGFGGKFLALFRQKRIEFAGQSQDSEIDFTKAYRKSE